MPRGGKREGSGRKVGARTQASKERVARVAKTGATPLEIMLEMMRESHADTLTLARQVKATTGPGKTKERDELRESLRRSRQDTMMFAKDTAPYVHPRLQSVLYGQDPDKPSTVIYEISEASFVRAKAIIYDA